MFFAATVMMLVPLLPRAIVKLFGEAFRAKFPNGFTVSVIVVVALRLPEVPVIVTVAVPFFAALLAVKVTTLDEVAGFWPKDAVMPLGSPEANSVTFPKNPFTGVMLTVLVPLPTLCVIATAPGAAERVKF